VLLFFNQNRKARKTPLLMFFANVISKQRNALHLTLPSNYQLKTARSVFPIASLRRGKFYGCVSLGLSYEYDKGVNQEIISKLTNTIKKPAMAG
jgi:hypothetical protein